MAKRARIPEEEIQQWIALRKEGKSVKEIAEKFKRYSAQVSQKLVAAGLIVVNEPPEFFAQTIKSDYEKYGALIKKIGLQPK